MLFPIFMFKDKGSDYGVIVPGLPGCYSSGKTMEEAMENAKEAIELHIAGMVEDGLEIPEQGDLDDYGKEVGAGGIAALVEVDTASYENRRSERVNVTFPKPLLAKIDKASERLGMTRSGLLQTAAKRYIAETEASRQSAKARRAVREPKPAFKKRGK